MAILAHSLTTKARVKSRLNLSVTTFDTLIDELINEVTDFIETKCERRFLYSTFSNETHNGSNADGSKKEFLILKNTPVDMITKIESQTGTQLSPAWVEFTLGDYDIDKQTGIIKIYGGVPKGFQNIRVTYKAGYKIDFAVPANHTLPYDISGLAEKLTVKAFKKRESIGKVTEGVGGDSITWQTDLDTEESVIIAKYSRPKFV